MSKTVIELAKQAGWEYADGDGGFEPLWRFAELVRADERAKLAEQPAPVQQETSDLKHLAAICPELNMSNYTSDDVDELNHWAIEVATAIDELAEQPAQPAPAAPVQEHSTCNAALRAEGKAYPRTCKQCGLGPCSEFARLNATKDTPQAQPAHQEPVAWWDAKLGVFNEKHFDQLQPLCHCSQAQRKPLTEILNDPEVHYPGNFDTPERANALLTGLCQDAAIEIERLNKAVADERERLYGKDIDTLLFEEHRLAFEKGRRSEREACARVAEDMNQTVSAMLNVTRQPIAIAAAIRARGNT